MSSLNGPIRAMDPSVRVVLMTAPSAEEAVSIVNRLVEERLVACGNVVPGLRSIYRWKGEVHDDPEVLVVLKTMEGSVRAVIERAAELHSYDVPEILVLPVLAGHGPYLDWVRDETSE